jgi:hypothetical protein
MAKLKDGTRIYGNANVDSTLTTLDLVVTGNITVQGTTTTVDSTVTQIEDPVITLGGGAGGIAATNDGKERGLILKYNDGAAKDGFMGWDHTAGEFALAATTSFDAANNKVSITTYGNVHGLHFVGQGDTLANITGANVTGTVANANNSSYAGTVTGASQGNITSLGTLTGLTVGNATANTTFGNGTINASGVVSVTDSTVSTSSSTGALKVTGGAGIGGNLYVGGNIYGNFAGDVLAKGANTYVQFNDDGNQNGVAGFTFSKTDSNLFVQGTANVGNLETAGTIKSTGTANVGNLVTPGYANIDKDLLIGTNLTSGKANANITGALQVGGTANVANLVTPGTANIDGILTVGTSGTAANANITGNLTVGANYSSTNGNISLTNGSITAGGNANITGTANVGNLTTGGNIDGTGASSTANVQYLTVRSTANITGTANVGNLVTPGFANIDKDLLVGKSGTPANANITGSLKVGSIAGNLVPSANGVYDLGADGMVWKDLWLSGSSIKIGTQTISTTTTNGGGIAISNNISASTLDVTGDANIGTTAGNLNVNGNLVVNARITSNVLSNTGVVFSNATHALIDDATFTFDSGLLKVGNIELSGTANVGNIKVRSLTDNAIPYTSAITANTLAADSTFTFEPATSLLKVGNVKATGTANVKTLISTDLTSTRIPFANIDKSLTDSGNLSFNTTGNIVSTDGLQLLNTANVNNVVVRSLTDTRIPFANAGNALVDSGNLTFNSSTKTLSADLFTGTLTTASQPNITSLGTLSSLVVSGNIQSNANVITDAILAKGTGNLTITAGATNGNVVLAPTGTGTVDVSSKRITGLGEPSLDTDAATKYYVDHVAQGLHVHAPVQVATTDPLSGYSANVITLGTALSTLDTYSVQSGDRILVKDQTAHEENGIYTIDATLKILTRSADTNSAAELAGGDFTFVVNGYAYGDTGWVQTEVVTNLGTDPIVWQQFSGAGQYTAGDGLDLSGTTFSVKVDNTTLEIASDIVKVKDSAQFVSPNIGAATGSSLNLSTGNITAGNAIIGSGTGGSITGANLVSANYFTGTLTTASQPNVTSLGTLTGLTVDGGTLSVANANLTIGSGYGIKSDNYWYANGDAIDFQTASGNATELQFKATGSNDLNASANLTFDSGNSNLTVTGNIRNVTGAIISGNIQANNLTSTRVVFAGTGGKLVDSANITFSGTELGITGTANVSGTAKAGNLQSSGLTATRVTYASTDGLLVDNANLTFSGTELGITGTANVSGTAKAGNLQSSGLTATRVTYASTNGLLVDSSNLTFSGTELGITGTANVSGTVNAGNVTSNGVTATQVVFATTGGRLTSDSDLTFDGTELTANAANVVNEFTAGNVTSRALTSGRVTFASSGGLLTDSSNLTFDGNVMTVTGNIQLNGTSGVGSLTGNGSISMTGNISSGNLEAVSGGLIKTTGNANVGNLNATNVFATIQTASQPNITSLGTLSSLTVSGTTNLGAVGNVTITGGTTNQYLQTDGAGHLTWVTLNTSGVSNGNSSVTVPALDGNILLTSGGNVIVTVTGTGANVTGYIDATGDINGDNITAGNLIVANSTDDATSSITGAITTPGGISAEGNIYTGHSIGFANNNGGTASKAYIQYNSTVDSLDFIFN